jgi:NADH-quinone oxidoreductase subunit J
MMLDSILFYFFAALAVGSAIMMVTRRNAVHSAVFLISTLLATAGIFLQLQAEFLFVVQIILYVGGIMVLFVFVIMLVNLDVAVRQMKFNRQSWVAGLLALVLGGLAIVVFRSGGGAFNFMVPPITTMPPNAEQVGTVLFQKYFLPFEIASILLLVAMIGAVVMAKRKI